MSPLVFRRGGYRVFFYSNEGDPREPVHVHVRKAGAEAKVRLKPEPAIAQSLGFNAREQSAILAMVREYRAELRERGMSTSATDVRFDEDHLWVDLDDGRTIGAPLAWFPRLQQASPAQRQAVEISPFGLHWEELDEDVSIEGLLMGRRDMTLRSAVRTPA